MKDELESLDIALSEVSRLYDALAILSERGEAAPDDTRWRQAASAVVVAMRDAIERASEAADEIEHCLCAKAKPEAA